MATNTTASFTIPTKSLDSGWAWVKGHPLLALLAVVVTQLYLTKRRHGLKDIPGPWLASFSNLWKLRAVWKQNMHRENLRVHEDYGDIVRIGPNHVSLADPKSLRAIYGVQNVFPKSAFYPLAEAIYRGRFLPTLFTTTSNDYHMRLKRGSVKAFSMDTVVGLEPYVDKCVGLLLQRLREVSGNGKVPINPVSWMHYFAFDVLGQVNFSKDLGFLEKGQDLDGIIAAIGGLLVYVSLIGQIPFAHKFLLGNPLIPKLFPSIEKTNKILQFSLTQVEERLRKPVERKDILNQLLASHKADPNSLTLDEIIAITTTNVIAGSDTTAVSLSSVIYHLSKFPEKKKKLEDEINSAQVEGRASSPITYAEAVKLPYLSAVINEAMRMHPATGFILERVVPEGGVTLHDVHLDEGTIVGVNAWVIHRNKAVFGEDVHTFRPERWIEGDEERIKDMKRNQFSFGYGPRSCIGKNISILEMWKVTFELYRHFDVNLVGDGEWKINGSWFTPQSKIEVVVRPRDVGAN
ncbi:cytochrome p450 oxidoreductase [Colletotrichum incanum]|uniref:Cytochrome p450 oxidoreductase n=1 Tax=Colletotrichum incanum TaxID=1573173 RepID=A0A161YNN9_COLIC|nr:cytochrome p450 oxidoreductase [Colletotrichum incanum]OHW95874.1 cytochrome p450 oxidoreductase [Colletotrichum incanum]